MCTRNLVLNPHETAKISQPLYKYLYSGLESVAWRFSLSHGDLGLGSLYMIFCQPCMPSPICAYDLKAGWEVALQKKLSQCMRSRLRTTGDTPATILPPRCEQNCDYCRIVSKVRRKTQYRCVACKLSFCFDRKRNCFNTWHSVECDHFTMYT